MNKPRTIGTFAQKHKLIWNLIWICLILLILAIAAHLVMYLGTRHGARRTVPDFSGIRLQEAEQIARDNDLTLHINDSLFVPTYEGGIVLDQLPAGGVEVKPGRTIYITINAFREKSVPVPYVAERSLRQAKNMLEIAGLEIAELVYRPDIATNYVLEQSYNGKPIKKQSKIEAPLGSGITLYVGVEANQNTTVVPLLAGYSLKAAKSRLWELGLNVGKIEFDEGINLLNQKDARLYYQSPAAERTMTLGTKVDLRFTLDRKKLSEKTAIAEKEAIQAAAARMAEEKERAEAMADSTFREAINPTQTDSTPEATETADTTNPTHSTTTDEGFFD